MEAPNVTRATDLEGDAPTTAQPVTFDARDRLAGRLDDTTVRQAAEKHRSSRLEPTPQSLETGLRDLQSADNAEVGQ